MPNPSYRRTLELIGRISVSWNEIETVWYLIYTCLVHELPRDKADAIYWTFQTFASQRRFTLGLAEPCFPNPKGDKPHPLRKQLGQINTKTEKLAGKRNAIIHADYHYDVGDMERPVQTIGLAISPGSRRKEPNRFASKDLPTEALLLVNEIAVLERELENYRRRLFREYLPADKRPSKAENEPLPRRTIPSI